MSPSILGRIHPLKKGAPKIRNNHHKHRINIKTSVGGNEMRFCQIVTLHFEVNESHPFFSKPRGGTNIAVFSIPTKTNSNLESELDDVNSD